MRPPPNQTAQNAEDSIEGTESSIEGAEGSIENAEGSFDDLMASLFVLVTHHSLTQCEASISPIVERLNKLCQHSEIEHYPNQLKVLAKMRQLWCTRLFNVEYSGLKH